MSMTFPVGWNLFFGESLPRTHRNSPLKTAAFPEARTLNLPITRTVLDTRNLWQTHKKNLRKISKDSLRLWGKYPYIAVQLLSSHFNHPWRKQNIPKSTVFNVKTLHGRFKLWGIHDNCGALMPFVAPERSCIIGDFLTVNTALCKKNILLMTHDMNMWA